VLAVPLALISYGQAVLLGLLQGFSELFPISSLGHSVILPRLLGWNIHQNDSFFVTFLVATHLATALVLLWFFRRDWARILRGLGRSLRDRQIGADDTDAKLGWLLVVGSVPAGLLGLVLEHPLRDLFASAQSAAAFLCLNGLLLLGAERLRRRAPIAAPEGLQSDAVIARSQSFGAALGIGSAQALALVPGLSRSGAAMGGGLLFGLSNEEAARFAFLLATPIIAAAGRPEAARPARPAGRRRPRTRVRRRARGHAKRRYLQRPKRLAPWGRRRGRVPPCTAAGSVGAFVSRTRWRSGA
jgi:undecaprenyl-diphosphatase